MNPYKFAVLALTLLSTTSYGAVLHVDKPAFNSILLENFSASTDSATELRNGLTFESASGGVAFYKTAQEVDPQIFFSGYVGGLDFSDFPNVRIRHAFSQRGKKGSFYPMPVSEAHKGDIGIHTVLTSRQSLLTSYPSQSTGIRIDPVDGAPLGGTYSIDYLFLDRGRTIGFEFDQIGSTRGGINNFFVGHGLGGQNGKELLTGISDGLFRGNPTTTDPMMVLQMNEQTGLSSIDPKIFKFIEIRMRVLRPSQAIATVFFHNISGGMSMNKIDLPLVNDEFFHTYLLDLRNNPSWNAGKVTQFRLDPVSQMQGFEIDYIRFYETVKLD
jgi:hypothetical protein